MSTDLRDALDQLARDVPALGDLDSAIATDARRRRRTSWVLATAAAVVAVVIVVGIGLVQTSRKSSAPEPAKPTPAVTATWSAKGSVLVDARKAAPIAEKPLPGGAVLAAADARQDGTGEDLVVVSGDQERLVVGTSSELTARLSPDGRLLAYVTNPRFGTDVPRLSKEKAHLRVVDLTTGQQLLDVELTAADNERFLFCEWSLDKSTLAAVTTTKSNEADLGRQRVRIWHRSGATLTDGASLTKLPGLFIGLTFSGEVTAVDHDRVATSPNDKDDWTRTDTPIHRPTDKKGNFGYERGVFGFNRWSPDGQVMFAKPTGMERRLQWVDSRTGAWTTQSAARGAYQLVGWQEGQPVVVDFGVSPSQIVRLGGGQTPIPIASVVGRAGLSVANDLLPTP